MHLSTALLARSAAGALTGTGLVAAAVLGVQHSAPGSPTATSTVAAHPTHGAGHGAKACRPHGLHVGKAPEALKKDLKAARARVKDSDAKGAARRQERREALTTIREAALDGKYGPQVQQRLEARRKKVEERRAALPAKLRSDLDALKKTDPGPARREAAKKVRQGRLDGTYGAEVQQRAQRHAQRRQEHRAACREQRQGEKPSGTTTG